MGVTWSYHPPQSSYDRRNAELSHALDRISSCKMLFTKRSPLARLLGGCSLAPDGTMYDTAGKVPSRKSMKYWLRSTMWLESCGSLIKRSKFSNGTQITWDCRLPTVPTSR